MEHDVCMSCTLGLTTRICIRGTGTATIYTRAAPPYPVASPLMTTSFECPPVLMARGTIAASKGNSTGAVLMTRTVLPEPGLSRTQKNGLDGRRGGIGALVGALERVAPTRAVLQGPSGRNSALEASYSRGQSARGFRELG